MDKLDSKKRITIGSLGDQEEMKVLYAVMKNSTDNGKGVRRTNDKSSFARALLLRGWYQITVTTPANERDATLMQMGVPTRVRTLLDQFLTHAITCDDFLRQIEAADGVSPAKENTIVSTKEPTGSTPTAADSNVVHVEASESVSGPGVTQEAAVTPVKQHAIIGVE